jgi:hypothetical protein
MMAPDTVAIPTDGYRISVAWRGIIRDAPARHATAATLAENKGRRCVVAETQTGEV